MTTEDDENESEYTDLNDISVQEKDKKFLHAIYDLDGKAKTTEIRERTGLSSGDTKYRFNKFSDNGIIEKDQEDPDDAKYHNPQNIAILTERGKEFINKGFTGGEVFEEERTKTVELTLEEYEELVEDIEQLENKLKVTQKKVEDMDSGGTEMSVQEEDLREILLDMDISPGQEGNTPSSFELKTRVESMETVTSNLMDKVKELKENSVTSSEVKKEVNKQVNTKLGESDHPAAQSYQKKQSDSENESNADKTEKIDTDEFVSQSDINQIENRLKEVEKDINYFYEWIQKTEVFLLGLKLFFKDRNVDLKPYLEDAKEKQQS